MNLGSRWRCITKDNLSTIDIVVCSISSNFWRSTTNLNNTIQWNKNWVCFMVDVSIWWIGDSESSLYAITIIQTSDIFTRSNNTETCTYKITINLKVSADFRSKSIFRISTKTNTSAFSTCTINRKCRSIIFVSNVDDTSVSQTKFIPVSISIAVTIVIINPTKGCTWGPVAVVN